MNHKKVNKNREFFEKDVSYLHLHAVSNFEKILNIHGAKNPFATLLPPHNKLSVLSSPRSLLQRAANKVCV